jgi:pyruvate kinase
VDLQPGDQVIVIKRRVIPTGAQLPYDDQRLIIKALVYGQARPNSVGHTAYLGRSIVYHR